MALNTKQLGGASRSRGRAPTKQSINFADVGKTSANYFVIIPVIAALILAGLLILQFGFIGRLNELSEQEDITKSYLKERDDLQARVESFGDLTSKYMHYTYKGMTSDELTRADRVMILGLIDNYLLGSCTVSSWTLSENILVLTITTNDIREANYLATQMQRDPAVQVATVNNFKSVYIPLADNPEISEQKCVSRMTVALMPKDTDLTKSTEQETETTEESKEADAG